MSVLAQTHIYTYYLLKMEDGFLHKKTHSVHGDVSFSLRQREGVCVRTMLQFTFHNLSCLIFFYVICGDQATLKTV